MHETYRSLGRNAHIKACSSPRRMFEKNPICTSHNQTYANPFVTICLAGSSMHVREKIGGTCGNPTQRSCEKVQKIHDSLKSASITERTKFLACGSDLRTYRSEHHLECARPYNRCNTFDSNSAHTSTLAICRTFLFFLLFVFFSSSLALIRFDVDSFRTMCRFQRHLPGEIEICSNGCAGLRNRWPFIHHI